MYGLHLCSFSNFGCTDMLQVAQMSTHLICIGHFFKSHVLEEIEIILVFFAIFVQNNECQRG
jgi:hypothetical protein